MKQQLDGINKQEDQKLTGSFMGLNSEQLKEKKLQDGKDKQEAQKITNNFNKLKSEQLKEIKKKYKQSVENDKI